MSRLRFSLLACPLTVSTRQSESTLPVANQFSDPNPYGSPQFSGSQGPPPNVNVKGKVLAPAIFLAVVGSLGLLVSLLNVVFALVMEANVDPDAPEFVQQMQENSRGVAAVAIQGCFAILNVVIIAGAVQMMRMKSWGLGLTASILAMVNIGTFCCILGLPAGIWSLVILVRADVKQAFASSSDSPPANPQNQQPWR